MKNIRHRLINGIPVLEVVPEPLKNEALPLVVYYHGWQSAKELILTQARKISEKGIRVLLPDAMNHGERKAGNISAIPSVTFWSSIQYNLIEFSLLTRFFDHHEMIKNKKIGVGGMSMGGITTCALLTSHTEIVAAASMMGTPKPAHFAHLIIEDADRRHYYVPKDLNKSLSWLASYDLSLHPETLGGRPLLLWHGTEDKKLPYQDVYDFYNNIHSEIYGRQLVFLTGKGEGHRVEIETMDRTADFFAEKLG